MKKIFEVLSKPARMILIIAAFAYAGLFAITGLGTLGGGFLSTVGGLIVTSLTVAAVVAVPILLLLKRENAAKLVFILVAGYWLVSNAQSYILNYGWLAQDSQDGLIICLGIFGFLAGLALTGVFVLMILHFILKKEVLKFVAVLVFLGAFLFIFVLMILLLVQYIRILANDGNVAWTNWIELLAMLAAPVAVFFGYLYFLGAPEYDLPKKAPKEKKEKEPKEEQPAPAEEEAPAEEPVEEPAEQPEEEKPEEPKE